MDERDQMDNSVERRRKGQMWGGLFLLLVGGIILMRQLDIPLIPYWLFSWPMILVAIGLFIGIRHNFTGAAWLIMIILGGIFLADDMFPDIDFHRFIVPAIIISLGLALILRPRHQGDCFRGSRYRHSRRERRSMRDAGFTPPPESQSGPQPGQGKSNPYFDDYVDSVAVFGGNHKVIMSKDFKGGEATSVFGGTELDLSQADINGTVVLELTQVMGGAKLIVPAHWNIKNEINAIFGGVDDKRQNRQTSTDPNKILILKGISFFGGLEIRNY